MSVVRVKKTKNFVTVCTQIYNDERISFKAKGLWGYCMSRPDDWNFHVNHLVKVSPEGKTAIYSCISELIEYGYIKKIQIFKDGRFDCVEYEVYEVPQIKEKDSNIKENLPLSGFLNTEKLNTENPPLLNTDLTKSPKSPKSTDVNDNTKPNPPTPQRGVPSGQKPADRSGNVISKNNFQERKKALREIELEEFDEEGNSEITHLKESIINKLAYELDLEDIQSAIKFVEFRAEDPEFQIESLTAFMIHSLKTRAIPPNPTQQENIRFCWDKKKELNLKRLKVYQDYCCDDDFGKELSTDMNPSSFQEHFCNTWGIKPDCLAGGKNW